MEPQFVTKPAFTVVGMCIQTTALSPDIPNLWQKFGPQMSEVQYLAEPVGIDGVMTHHIAYGLMDHYDENTGKFDYLAGEAVTKVEELPAGMTAWNIPANTYAVFETTLPTLGADFGHIFSTWLPLSGYQQANGPYYEHYGETFNPDDPTSTLSIYIPVEKKT